jgi:hypothetical protein
MRGAGLDEAVAATTAAVRALGLEVDESVVVHDSNDVAIRLEPCAVLARTSFGHRASAERQVAVARGLAAAGAPVAALDPRVPEQPIERDGFVVTLWTYHAPVAPGLDPDVYADALARLHAGLRTLTLTTPHLTDRVAAARSLLIDPERSPALAAGDRRLLVDTLDGLEAAVLDRRAPEQIVHGEPHPGNVLATAAGPRFIDLETCSRGPIEVDLAYVPTAVAVRYPGADHDLLADLRGLVLATVAAWRWDATDLLPGGHRAGIDLVHAVRAGPPWPDLQDLMPRGAEPPPITS